MNLNSLVRYFDLASATRGGVREKAAGAAPPAPWFPQWVALVAGILAQPLFEHYRSTHTWDLSSFPGWIPFAVLVSILIFPGVYKNAFDPSKPIAVQFCAIFAGGMGWQALLQTARALS